MFSLGIIFNGKTENQINYNRAQPIIVIFLGFSSCIWVLCFVLFLLLWMLLLIKFVTIIADILLLLIFILYCCCCYCCCWQCCCCTKLWLGQDAVGCVRHSDSWHPTQSYHKGQLHEGTILWTYSNSTIPIWLYIH